MGYVEFHACSAFSFLRGGSFPEHIAEAGAQLGLPAVALLDRNGVYGAQRFAVKARECGVRPIVGCELTMEDGSILPVLVKTETGYANLCSLLTEAHLRSETKGECAVQWDELPNFSEGVVALLGSARLQRAGRRILRRRTSPHATPSRATSRFRKSSRMQDAFASTLQACVPQNLTRRAKCLTSAFGHENVYV